MSIEEADIRKWAKSGGYWVEGIPVIHHAYGRGFIADRLMLIPRERMISIYILDSGGSWVQLISYGRRLELWDSAVKYERLKLFLDK